MPELPTHPTSTDCTRAVDVVVVGDVDNRAELAETLRAQGHLLRFGDAAEVFAHLVERALAVDPDLDLAVALATAQIEGACSTVVLHVPTGRVVADSTIAAQPATSTGQPVAARSTVRTVATAGVAR